MSRPRSRSTSTPPQGCKSRHGNGAEEFHVPASGHGPVHTPCYVPKCWGCLGQWSARVCTRSLHPLLDFPQRTCALLWAAGVFLRRALCPRTPRGSDHATYSTPCALRCTLFACAWRPTPFAPWVSLLSPFLSPLHCTWPAWVGPCYTCCTKADHNLGNLTNKIYQLQILNSSCCTKAEGTRGYHCLSRLLRRRPPPCSCSWPPSCCCSPHRVKTRSSAGLNCLTYMNCAGGPSP